MKKAKRKRSYDSSGRREEAERTRARIVEAAAQLLQRVRGANLSYADVAQLSGVAVRTVYRHFPEPVDLLRAVAWATIARLGGLSDTRSGSAVHLGKFHQVLSAEPTLFRILLAAPVRSELDYGRYIRALYADLSEGLPPERANALYGLMELMASPFAWEVLHSQWQLPPERITRACLAAAQWIAEGIQRHPDWLDPSAPLPPLFRAPRAPGSKRKDPS